MMMLNEIAIPDNAKPWLEEALAAGREIVGFGHHVCENGDSRVATMRAALGVIAALRGGQPLVKIYDALAAATHEARGLRPSLDYPIGPVYHLIGLDASAFTPILIAASIPGWAARITGQLAPTASSSPSPMTGSPERHPVLEREIMSGEQ
jgi:citrate synthase